MFDFEEQEEMQSEVSELTLNFDNGTEWNMVMLITNFLENKGFLLSSFEMSVLKVNGKIKKCTITDKDAKNWMLVNKFAVESDLEDSVVSSGVLNAICPEASDMGEIQDAVDDFFWTIGFYGDEDEEDDDEEDPDAKYLENIFADDKYAGGEYSLIGYNSIDGENVKCVLEAMEILKNADNEIDKLVFRYIDDEEFINVLLEELTWDEAFTKVREYGSDEECEFNAAILSVKRNEKYSEDDIMELIGK